MTTDYVDIHSHILPGIDDGARSLDESTAMMKMAYMEGIRTIIATPHYGMPNYEINQADCEMKVEELNAVIRMVGELEGMSVILGNEILYHTGVSEEIKNGAAKTLGDTNFVLIEFYESADYTVLSACAREMKMAGYRPVFAHVERYSCLRDSVAKVESLRLEGALVQVNAGELLEGPEERDSLPAKRGLRLLGGSHKDSWEQELTERRLFAWRMIKNNLVDFVASDSHRMDVRVPVMESAIANIREIAGEDIANSIVFNSQIIR